MSVKSDNFIFRRAHRRLTYLSVVALLPALLTALAAGLVWWLDLANADFVLGYILALPAGLKAVIWLFLPLLAVRWSHQGAKQGTLHKLRPWNLTLYRLGLLLLFLEAVIVITTFL